MLLEVLVVMLTADAFGMVFLAAIVEDGRQSGNALLSGTLTVLAVLAIVLTGVIDFVQPPEPKPVVQPWSMR